MPAASAKGYPARYESRLTLKNGSKVFLRPIVPTDEPLLADLFARMSPRSRYLRFMTHLTELPESLLHDFTHLDYDTAFALTCVVEEDGQDAIIAVGRYALDPDEGAADLAVAVRDDWQQLGLGTVVLSRIITIGREHGISRFTSMMDPHNEIMKRTIRALGCQVTYRFRNGSYQVEIVVGTASAGRGV